MYTGGVGGITGYNNTATGAVSVVKNSCNFGTIWGCNEVGGIVGRNTLQGDIYNCFNAGKIKNIIGRSAGGISGINHSARTYNCYNYGTINNGTIAGICPTLTSTSGYQSSLVSSCYIWTGTTADSRATVVSNKTTLLNNLNSWVASPAIAGEYSSWIIDESKNNGFPIFDWMKDLDFVT